MSNKEKQGRIVEIPAYVAEKLNEELQHKNDFIDVVLNTVDALVAVFDTEGRIVLFNRICEKLTGYTFDEVKGKPFWDLLLIGEEAERVRIMADTIFGGNSEYPLRNINYWKCRDGGKLLVSWSNSVLRDNNGKVRFVVSTGIDITQWDTDSRALLESESKFRSLFHCARDAIFICEVTEDGRLSNYLDVNEEACRRLGYTKEEFRQMSPETIGVLDEKARQHSLDIFAETGSVTFSISLLAKDGRAVPFEFSSYLIHANGKALSMAIAREITERLSVEAKLRESEERYRRLVELSPDAIFIIQDGELVFANSATARLLGLKSAEAAVGLQFAEIVEPRYRQAVFERLDRLYRSGGSNSFAEQQYLRQDGSTVDVEVTSTLHTFSGKPAVQVIVRDISTRKKLEQEVLKVQKLQSVGKLAGSIAHEYNNLLTVILGNLSLARIYSSHNAKAAEILTSLEAAAMDARELTQRLLTFAKGGLPVKQPVNLRNLLFNACNQVSREGHIQCVLHIPADLMAIEADEGQLKQAICNIVSNAVQAMPAGGKVDVSANNIRSCQLPQLPLAEGDYVIVTFADEGPGIPAERLHDVFDPFYSTKPDGSGLGLSTAYSIVSKHGGHLTVDPECGKGATFLMVLPAISSPVTFSSLVGPDLQGSGRILLMDDEDAVRNTAAEMISLLGYQVATAANGEDALRVWTQAKEAGNPFDLVILDLVIKGGTGGKATMAALQEMDSAVRALVSSGYSGDPVMAEYKKYGFCGCVPKPYTIEQLGNALRLAINSGE